MNKNDLLPGVLGRRVPESDGLIIDMFAGPGGWSEGLRLAGRQDFGIEHDPSACDTRYAAGHATWLADLRTVDPLMFGRLGVEGLIASPPCQSFSAAGNRAGLEDPRGELVWLPMMWVSALQPDWVALEQVPEVLPIWRQTAQVIEQYGYRTWTGILNAADYGVPQTRRRAILLARLDDPITPPEPTHAEVAEPESMFGPGRKRWVTMAEALGWTDGRTFDLCTQRDQRPDGSRQIVTSDRPAPALDTQGGKMSWLPSWPWTQPATTIAGDPRITVRCHHDEGSQGRDARTTEQVRAGDYEGTEPIKLTLVEALTLQGFRADYPLAGNKGKRFEQVGNAIPPPLAAVLLRQLLTAQSDESGAS